MFSNKRKLEETEEDEITLKALKITTQELSKGMGEAMRNVHKDTLNAIYNNKNNISWSTTPTTPVVERPIFERPVFGTSFFKPSIVTVPTSAAVSTATSSVMTTTIPMTMIPTTMQQQQQHQLQLQQLQQQHQSQLQQLQQQHQSQLQQLHQQYQQQLQQLQQQQQELLPKQHDKLICLYCKKDHWLHSCPSIPENYKGFCVHCWQSNNHVAKDCKNKKSKEPWQLKSSPSEFKHHPDF
ncbi:hypothetical protein RclHR1_21470003 [Rhizophagus clarus]|uniref:CCHC-type domain-containing protein n=1 Tax=Rhizophagus clarus TaxID=94130 RepID=A0A2Z6QSB9_9GLOM|nr:hypothetical protein RclHR1_21470003 [Rhizophagus clarus]